MHYARKHQDTGDEINIYANLPNIEVMRYRSAKES